MVIWRSFYSKIIIRVVALVATISLIAIALVMGRYFLAAVILLVVGGQVYELLRQVTKTNKKLVRLFESIRYSDFTTGFASSTQLGSSFKELNMSFNEVLEAFKETRTEKEESGQYLQTIVRQINTGIISFSEDGTIQLMNAYAKRYTGGRLNSMSELEQKDLALHKAVMEAGANNNKIHEIGDFQLSIQSTGLRIRGQAIKLVTLQDIRSELQQQELLSWQNLTKVLRHEIMNSITPITSLTSTMRDILARDLQARNSHMEMSKESADDLGEGLKTIENRSKGLLAFIDAYREYTSIPQLHQDTINVYEMLEEVVQLLKQNVAKSSVTVAFHGTKDLTVFADKDLIEQVLINLVKNAIESLGDQPQGKIEIRGTVEDNHVRVSVEDNGPGIIEEAREQVFVPFFSTKRTGSGIGLALSRQIMHLHHGTLTLESEPNVKTTFYLRF